MVKKKTNTHGQHPKARILIIDDDEQIQKLLARLLSTEHDCTCVESAEKAISLLEETKFNLIISDIQMNGTTGLELVPIVFETNPDAVVVMISGQQTIDYAIEAMRVGAFDYITKPLNIDHVEAAVRRALAHHYLLAGKRRHENELEELVVSRTAELEHLAYYDRVTGLPNRTLFVNRCSETAEAVRHTDMLLGVIYVSIDQFKKINDTLGHAAGDQLLREIALRLRESVTDADTVARFEGPEFGVLLPKFKDPNAIEEVAAAITDSVRTSFYLPAQEVYLTPSIGISLFPHDEDDITRILQKAGAALLRAKQLGGNNYQFYSEEMNIAALKRLTLEASLRHAIERDEFVVHYQPIVDLTTNRIQGLEALVRWQHPVQGLLAPSEFLAVAMDTGLILDISFAVLCSACHQTRQWQLAGRPDLRIAVNVSPRQFRQKDFVERVRQVLSDADLDPGSLELELTESSIMEDAESAAEILAEIRASGIRVAIDDFGTGYSSLAYLKRFRVDTLKVDRCFVNGATRNRDDAALVRAMVALAHDLRLRVVAEGIETEEELSFLRSVDCDEGQGFLFSRPQPVEQLSQILGVRGAGRIADASHLNEVDYGVSNITNVRSLNL
jgi:diguanylate cyclase (GGDEF)-like protein